MIRSETSLSELQSQAYGLGAGAEKIASPSQRIIARIDEALNRLDHTITNIEDKLEPLDCTVGACQTGSADPSPPPPSEYGSNLLCTLDSRARKIDELSNRLARLHARTEL